jgi:hypothetical protein
LGDVSHANRITGDAEDAWGCLVECGSSRECSDIVLRGEVQLLVSAPPIEHAANPLLDDRHLRSKHVHECAIENRGDLDWRSIRPHHKLTSQIGIAIVAWLSPGEVGRKVRGDESGHAGLNRSIERDGLALNNDVVEPAECRDDAPGPFAGSRN